MSYFSRVANAFHEYLLRTNLDLTLSTIMLIRLDFDMHIIKCDNLEYILNIYYAIGITNTQAYTYLLELLKNTTLEYHTFIFSDKQPYMDAINITIPHKLWLEASKNMAD